MPIYEYQCKNKHLTERRMKADANVKQIPCPECAETAEKIFSRTARPRFEGTGFYETDYKR